MDKLFLNFPQAMRYLFRNIRHQWLFWAAGEILRPVLWMGERVWVQSHDGCLCQTK